MNQTIKTGLALVLVALLVLLLGGSHEALNDGGKAVGVIGLVMCIVGLVRPTTG